MDKHERRRLGEDLIQNEGTPNEQRVAAGQALRDTAFAEELRRQAAVDTLLKVRTGAMPARQDMLENVNRRITATTGRAGTRVRLPAPPPARAWGWRITALAASFLIAAGLLFHKYWPGPMKAGTTSSIAQITQARGKTTLLRGATQLAAVPGHHLLAHDRLFTGPGAQLTLRYRDATTVRVGPHSDLIPVLLETARAQIAQLAKGTLRAEVATQAVGRRWCVRTPHAEVRVLGTIFSVVARAHDTRVEVESGSVRVVQLANGQSVTIAAGQHAIAGRARLVTGAGRPRSPSIAARVLDGLRALYTFETGHGMVVQDVSGVGSPLDLHIDNRSAVEWLPGGGLRVLSPTRIVSDAPAYKILAACKASNELTVEAWVKPATLTEGRTDPLDPGARIVTLSYNPDIRNFTLGQRGVMYQCRLRTTATDENGQLRGPQYPVGALHAESRQTRPSLMHMLAVREAAGRARFFINGEQVAELHIPGRFSNWDETLRLCLAREFSRDVNHGTLRPWHGTLYLVAVYDRALSDKEIEKNYQCGPPNRDAMVRNPPESTAIERNR